MQIYMCPRIRLTKTDKKRLILPIDAITGIEESAHDRTVRVTTIDGFWYDVMNQIIEIDKKIEESIGRVNASVMKSSIETVSLPPIPVDATVTAPKIEEYENSKSKKIKQKKALSAREDKPARREPTDNKGNTASTEAAKDTVEREDAAEGKKDSDSGSI